MTKTVYTMGSSTNPSRPVRTYTSIRTVKVK